MHDSKEMSDNSPAMVWRVGEDRRVDWASKPLLDFTGYTLEEIVGHEWTHCIHEADRDNAKAAYSSAFDVRQSFSATYRLRRFDGEFRWVVDHATPFLREGSFAGYFGSVTDINDEHDAHAALIKLLTQRDVLLSEIHHRVKNNLQQIEGLIALESARIAEPEAQRAMRSISSRVRAMGTVHKHLVKSTNFKEVRTDVFLADLTAELARAHGADRKGVEVNAAVERGIMNVDKSMTLGLIVNELVTNAITHAFPDNRPGHVSISFGPSTTGLSAGKILEVADNGIGLAAGNLEAHERDGSGLRLVRGFAQELNGHLSVAHDKGTKFRIHLP